MAASSALEIFGITLVGAAPENGKKLLLLAVAPMAGLLLGLCTSVSDLLLSSLFAFLAGGVILNVLKEGLPGNRQSRFSAFALGATFYAALLLLLTA